MTLYQEQMYISTLLEMYEPQSITNIDKALSQSIENVSERVLKTKGRWTRARLRYVQKQILDELKIPYDNLFTDLKDDVEFTSKLAIGSRKIQEELSLLIYLLFICKIRTKFFDQVMPPMIA